MPRAVFPTPDKAPCDPHGGGAHGYGKCVWRSGHMRLRYQLRYRLSRAGGFTLSLPGSRYLFRRRTLDVASSAPITRTAMRRERTTEERRVAKTETRLKEKFAVLRSRPGQTTVRGRDCQRVGGGAPVDVSSARRLGRLAATPVCAAPAAGGACFLSETNQGHHTNLGYNAMPPSTKSVEPVRDRPTAGRIRRRRQAHAARTRAMMVTLGPSQACLCARRSGFRAPRRPADDKALRP